MWDWLAWITPRRQKKVVIGCRLKAGSQEIEDGVDDLERSVIRGLPPRSAGGRCGSVKALTCPKDHSDILLLPACPPGYLRAITITKSAAEGNSHTLSAADFTLCDRVVAAGAIKRSIQAFTIGPNGAKDLAALII